ncbi:glutamine synthetase family protein [Oleisolibacter albus]|uniref:glutamine synthetase family protein n=1 Tax=Oleisolibacter albus TaxID=2171757 RepID=UPI000DF4A9FE|nr:glutamine synthetase family protein [Oleisolibacter albus]
MSSDSLPPEIQEFRSRHPDIGAVDVLLPDLCGVYRGKRVPMDELDKVYGDGVALPGCTFAVDITGETIEETGMSIERGVPDQICRPVAGTLAPVPWAAKPLGQVLLNMRAPDGGPFPLAPRSLVEMLLTRLKAKGLTPVVAIELEFYLIAGGREPGAPPQPPVSPRSGLPQNRTQVYGLAELEDFEAVLDEITASARAQGIPAGTAIAEYGPGQYEITLSHVADALKAADDAILFKRAVKGVAQRHGFEATFMAKPYTDQASSGMHIHMSVLGPDGRNIFAAEAPEGSEALRWAIGGLAETMPACMALAAPGANSWRRFQVGSYAPTVIAWGVNNRTAPLRIPAGPPASRRVEYRIAGADANPYLVLAGMLAGLLHGLENRIDPGPPLVGNAYGAEAPHLPTTWEAALDLFGRSAVLRRHLGDSFIDTYRITKEAERAKFAARVTPLELDWYLRSA